MTWVKVVDGEVVETRSKAPTMERRLADRAWQQLIPEQPDMFELCGWFEVAKASAPVDGFAYTGEWTVDVGTGRPEWSWTRGDALPDPVPDPVEQERDVVAWDAMVGRALIGAMRSYAGPITGAVVDALAAEAEATVAAQVAQLDLLSAEQRAVLVGMRHAEERAKVDSHRGGQ